MRKSKMLTALIAVGAVVLTSAVTPASAARRGVACRNAAVAAGIAAGLAAAVAASSGAYYYSGYGYGRNHGRCAVYC
jgi:hypothetical protein